MSFANRVMAAFGAGKAQTVLASPWADSSHLGEVVFQDIFGIDAQGPVTRAAAVRLATVAKGRDVLTGMIARMPLVCVRDGKPISLQPSFFQQPEQGTPLSVTLTWTVDALFFHGRAWWHVTEYDAAGWPRWVRRVPEEEVTFDESGRVTHFYGAPVNARDVIRFDGPHEGVLTRGADTIRRATRINRAAAKAEDNPVPSIDLHNEGENLSQEEIDKLTANWRKARAGSGVGYSSKALTVRTLGQHPEQLLIDGRKAINLELARHMGAPEWAVSVATEGSSLTYTNRQSRNGELIDQFLSPYMTAIKDRLSLRDITPLGQKVVFDLSELVREDTGTRYANYKLGLDMGIFDVAYVQQQENLQETGDSTSEQTPDSDS